MMNLTKKLELMQDMTESEKTISHFILDQGMEVLSLSVKDLAKATYTSPATVVRLTKKLGLDGYNDFKIKYSAELQSTLHTSGVDVNFPFTEYDSAQQVVHQMATMTKEVIDDTLQLIDYVQLDRAVKLILQAECIDIYGVGNTISAALTFQHELTRIGRNVNMRLMAGEQHFLAQTSNPKHVAVVISYSGETSEVIRTARILSASHTPIIAITSIGDNRLSRLATVTLNVSSREKLYKKIAPFASTISINYMLNLLFSLTFKDDYDVNLDWKLRFDRMTDNRAPQSSPIIEDNH